jgi:ribosomal protein S18 acetylase RimI-like enzyme
VAITSRPWRGPADIGAIQASISTSWLIARPVVSVTAGDVAWWLASAASDTAWVERIRLWERDGEVVAWAWFGPPDAADLFLRADVAPVDRRGLIAAIGDWLVERVDWWAATSPDAPQTPATRILTWALDADDALRADLTAAAFVADAEPEYSMFHRRLDDDRPLPEAQLPPGYRVRAVRLPEELEARVDVHRAAFAPSRMTVEKHGRLLDLPGYSPDHDLVVEAPDGSLAAFTLVWWDPVARAGEFEPVGVHPDHRRRGLGRAVNVAGLHLLRRLGAIDAVVFSRQTNVASEMLYASAGFERLTTVRRWSRPLEPR